MPVDIKMQLLIDLLRINVSSYANDSFVQQGENSFIDILVYQYYAFLGALYQI